MNYIIRTKTGFTQWTANSKDEKQPVDAISVADDHWTMTGYNSETHYPNWETLELIAYTPEEITARTSVEAARIADETFKTNRAAAVHAIKVTVNGMEFDGDEDSQSRMSLAILAAKTLGSPLIPLWKLADNSTAFDIPVADLEMALALSVVAMAEVWV